MCIHAAGLNLQIGRAMQLLLSQSPYRDLVIPWKFFHVHDMDAVDLLPTVVQFFIFKPVLLTALSCKHMVSFHIAYCSYFKLKTEKKKHWTKKFISNELSWIRGIIV